MPIALEVRGLVKGYYAGAGTCSGSARVLRGVDLSAQAGEAILVVGDVGSGKSTLMLCLAGLLSADAGELIWFGDPARASAVRRVVYHLTRSDLLRGGCLGQSNLHLLDIDPDHSWDGLDEWVLNRRAAGDTVVIATRNVRCVAALRPRILRLTNGRLHEHVESRPAVRVAEGLLR